MLIVSLAALFGLNPCANADILRVDGTNGTCAGNGEGWGASAYKYLQDALAAASGVSEDQIWVRAGTYYVDQSCANEAGSGDREETFQLVKDVFLLGGFNGTESFASERDPVANVTILSGAIAQGQPPPAPPCAPNAPSCFQPHEQVGCFYDIDPQCCVRVCDEMDGDPFCCEVEWDQHCVQAALDSCGGSYHVVTAGGEIDDPENTVIDGFTIRDGWANGDTNLDQHHGGGMFIEGEPSVVRCTFTQNTASKRGGGMSIRGIQPWIINCIVANNPGDPATPGDERLTPEDGGGLASFLHVDPILTNCLAVGNAATDNGGGIFTEEGVCAQGVCGDITLINCTLVSNTADADNSGFGSGGGPLRRWQRQ